MRYLRSLFALLLLAAVGNLVAQNTERQDFYKTIMSYVGEGPYIEVYNWNDKAVSSWTLLDFNDSIYTDVNMYYSNGKIDSISGAYPGITGSQKIYGVLWNNGNISELYRYVIDDSSVLQDRYLLVHDTNGNLTQITKQNFQDPSWYDVERRIFTYDQDRISEVLHEIRNAGQWENYTKYELTYSANNIEICKKYFSGTWISNTLYTITHNGTAITERLKQNYDANDDTVLNNRSKLEYQLNGDLPVICNYSLWQDSLWVSDMRYTYNYDTEMRLVQIDSEIYAQGQWLDSFRDVFTYLAVTAVTENAPAPVFLLTNYPNPFNPETTIQYSLNNPGEVCLEIYNLKGQKVKTLVDAQVSAGSHSTVWKGETDSGKDVSSGVYFLRLVSGQQDETRKVVLMK